MWNINNFNYNFHLSHTHGNLEIYIFDLDDRCVLCKELIPDYIITQKKLLGGFNYEIKSTTCIFYKFRTKGQDWGKYNIEDPFDSYYPHDKISITSESKKEIAELFKKYGYGMNVDIK